MNRLRRVGRFATLAVVLGLVVGVFLSGSWAPAEGEPGKKAKYPQHILLIRHAEKTGDKNDVHLSRQGKERAEALNQLFVASKARPDPFPTPDFIIAASHHKDSQRPVETVAPLAKKLKLTIIDRYDSKLLVTPGKDHDKEKPANQAGMAELRNELFSSSQYFGKTILVSWRHSTLPELAKVLKGSKVPEKWEDAVFDRVWQITYDDQGNTTFRDRPQRLLPGDAEK
jgi:hypothetical protein